MFGLPGYQIQEQIQVGISTDVYRCYDERQRKSVIVKILKKEYPSLEEIARLRQEYKIIQNLDYEGIVKPYSLEEFQHQLALILEDFDGQSLKQLLSYRTIPIQDFLPIAISLADTLKELHKIPVIHKDINPSNIIINPATGKVKLTDFGIASLLSVENPAIINPGLLEGTLAYISPEQTGRMNRSIDYRTDFYSLGATFYELLTGQLPFKTNDPLELIHYHLAKNPVPPHKLNQQIPEIVSSIVMKLLAKNAEDRYQSAAGLKFDLENCLSQLQTSGKIEKFILGSHDRENQLLIPQKLYGRETEVATLMDAFERVSHGATELLLISGYSGIGKTSVVNEVHKPIVKTGGYFITGKFDQFKRDIPYAALIQAFGSLIQQLLTVKAQQLAVWKEKISAALGTNGRIVIDIIPEVELIIGEQPDVPQVGASEAENRFNRVFQQFIHIFCQPEHPLVLFLDDLQWADLASLKLLQNLMTDPDSQYLLIIGAYRDNEVSPTHPLIQTLEKIQSTDTVVHQIAIKPLKQQQVNQLVAETLNDSEEAVETHNFASLLFHKTQGNPFFLTQLLKTLYAEGLLVYEASSGKWHWESENIQAIGIADYNVVALIARNIGKLSEATQQILKLAACLGNQFNLEILATVNEISAPTAAAQLWEALQSGLILPLSDTYKIPLLFGQEGLAEVSDVKVDYKFLHDRVQQAAYSLISEDEKKATHLKIGQLLLRNSTTETRNENIFALVNQLNFGMDLLAAQSEKDELAELNLIAAQKAKVAAAHKAAFNYVDVGLELLADDSWDKNYDLTLSIYQEAVEITYLNSNFERAEILFIKVIKEAKSLLEKIKVYEAKIIFYTSQNQMQLALDTILNVLELLGVTLSQEVSQTIITDDLVNLPDMTDPYKLAALRILKTAMTPAYVANPVLLFQCILTMVNFCMEYGNSPLSAYIYSVYGLLLCGVQGDINTGYRFGNLALKLLEQFDSGEIKSKVLDVVNGHIRIWKDPIRETLEPLQESFQTGLDSGDVEYACIAALNYCTHIFWAGKDLKLVKNKHDQYIDLMLNLKQEYHNVYLTIGKGFILKLMGDSDDKYYANDRDFKETDLFLNLINSNNQTSLFYIYSTRSNLFYLFKKPDLAINNAKEAEKYEQAVAGLITVAIHNFYYSLALLADYFHVDTQQQSEYFRQVETNQEKMKNWAYHAPSNFQHKYELIEAEKARVFGQNWEAMELYDRAIKGAKEQGYTQEEALANELAAEFYLSHHKEKIAQTYLTNAYYAYSCWGAVTKVKDLEARYPQFLSQIYSPETASSPGDRKTDSTTTLNSKTLDLASIIKATQAISQEIFLERLLDQLMKILLENCGAQTGFLILPKEDKLVIAIAASITTNKVMIQPSMPIELSQRLPSSVVNYVARTKKYVVLTSDNSQSLFADDPYLQRSQPKSVLCIPIVKQNQLLGIVYLENNLINNAFTNERLEICKILCAQAAISLENATFYSNLQQSKAIERAAEEMRKVLEKERELNELKSRFISMASHELRTPLTTILSSNELLKDYSHKWSEEKKRVHFERIHSAVRRMNNLMEDILTLGKAEARKIEFEPVPIDLIQFCRGLIEEIQLISDPNKYQISFTVQGESFAACMDEKLLRHILTNLLTNAVKYSPAGGTVRFHLILKIGEAIFQIQDQGIGIPVEDQKHLFESFHRANNVGGIPGTGLGLAIVKKSVDLHHGKITVDSEIGVGTTFTVTIPSSENHTFT
jgi:predicted ATPase/signal transduction histidine kinase/tRNA A-37 threonylcarbamoyl transferase component Bud32